MRRAADEAGDTLPLGTKATELYEAFAAEHGNLDFSAIIKTVQGTA